MTMRLAYRVLSMPVLVYPEIANHLETSVSQSEAIKECPKIILDNVYDHYCKRGSLNIRSDVPNWSPPFRQFFVEWNDSDAQSGILAYVFDANDVALPRLMGANREMDESLQIAKDVAKWVIVTSLWFTHSKGQYAGRPLCALVFGTLIIDRAGKLLWHGYTGEGIDIDGTEMNNVMTSRLLVLGLGLSFMNCRNVKCSDRVVECSRQFHKRTKAPQLLFKTLDITPMRDILRHEGYSDTEGTARALHICRGHFATYSEDRPLFGRLSGTFWVSDHVRGKSENGEVVKNYKVCL